MGCDIHVKTQVKWAHCWHDSKVPRFENYRAHIESEPDLVTDPFARRFYFVFYFLAGVRGPFEGVSPKWPDRGYPEGVKDPFAKVGGATERDFHSRTWITAQELVSFDYTREVSPGCTHERLLGEEFMKDIEVLRMLEHPENTRFIIAFDN